MDEHGQPNALAAGSTPQGRRHRGVAGARASSDLLLDVAILTQDGSSAHVDLAIQGRRADRWYPVSKLTIRN